MLATLEELKSYLNITDESQDTLLNIFLSGSDNLIKTYLGREIENKDYTEYFDGNAQLEIILSNYPVITLTSISRNIGTLDDEDFDIIPANLYKLNPKTGKIFFMLPIYRGFQNYKVIYNAGYTTIPGDLKLACLKLASKFYNTKTSDGIKSESVNQDRLDYDTSELPNDILNILNTYRDINV